MKVYNLENPNGNKVPNQFVINDGKAVYFQSYNSIIAKYAKGKLTLFPDWDYSMTTRKYLYQFLKEEAHFFYLPEYTRKAILEAIKAKRITLKK